MEKEKRRNGIIEATMKQELPAWVGGKGGCLLPPFNQNPSLKGRKDKTETADS